MSTFTNSSFPPASAASPSFASALRDDMLVRDLRGDHSRTLLPRLNTDLRMQLSPPVYDRIRAFFRDTARRDPTVGELRLLDALDRYGKDIPARIAVGELTTRDPSLAETWADMMGLHGALCGVGTSLRGQEAVTAPPCPLPEALSLTGRYLNRTAPRWDAPLLLASPEAEAEATALGHTLTARVAIDSHAYTLWKRRAPLAVLPAAQGDFILYLPRVAPAQMQAFVAEIAEGCHSFPFDIRPISRRSFLCTLLKMAPSVELYTDRLGNGTADHIPEASLCACPVLGPDGACDYLLRTPAKQVQAVTEALKRHSIPSTVCGRVTKSGTAVIHLRSSQNAPSIAVVRLPADFLLSMCSTYLHTFCCEVAPEAAVSPVSPSVTRLPSPRPSESGLSPHGPEVVALALHEKELLSIPEEDVLMTAKTVALTQETAYSAAMRLITEVTDTVASAAVSPANIRLSVVLTLPDSTALPRGETLSAVCGVYRVAARRGLPVEEPVIRVDSTRTTTLTAVAYARDKAACTALVGGDDNQWHISGEPCHKESQGFLFPVVRRAYEGCLNALTAALNRDAAARCVLNPIAMDAYEVEIPAEDPDMPPRKETRYTLNSTSVEQFCRQMHNWLTPVFCLSEADTRALLSQPAVVDALHRLTDMGYPVIVLGESCTPFAEYGFLPAALTSLKTLTPAVATATVTYTLPAKPSTRLIRGPLLTHDEVVDLPSLMSLQLPDGSIIPDGFISENGKVLGILNGVDTTLLPLLRQHNFDL